MKKRLQTALGFIVENIWLAVTKGYVNNRNMNAPFLVGYGLLVISLFFVLGTPLQVERIEAEGRGDLLRWYPNL